MKFIKGKSLLICILILIILVSIGVFAILKFNENKTKLDAEMNNRGSSIILDANGKAKEGEFKSKTSDQTLSELQKAQVNVTDKISSSISFPKGAKDSVGTWVVENLKSNNVIMQCEVYQDEKLLAKSVPIYPDEHIETVNLLDNLESGTYDVVAYINYFKLDTNEYISKAGYKINLVVQ